MTEDVAGCISAFLAISFGLPLKISDSVKRLIWEKGELKRKIRIKNKDEFGEERLIQAALKYRELPAQKMIEFILAEVDKFSERLEPDDDRTLVIVKRADHPG